MLISFIEKEKMEGNEGDTIILSAFRQIDSPIDDKITSVAQLTSEHIVDIIARSLFLISGGEHQVFIGCIFPSLTNYFVTPIKNQYLFCGIVYFFSCTKITFLIYFKYSFLDICLPCSVSLCSPSKYCRETSSLYRNGSQNQGVGIFFGMWVQSIAISCHLANKNFASLGRTTLASRRRRTSGRSIGSECYIE